MSVSAFVPFINSYAYSFRMIRSAVWLVVWFKCFLVGLVVQIFPYLSVLYAIVIFSSSYVIIRSMQLKLSSLS